MTEKHFVIVGNGPAGNQAACTLREKDPAARITLIGRERGSCYAPHLLPEFIAGRITEQDLYVSPIESYKEKNIKLRCCQKVAAIDLQQRQLIMEHKEVLPFDGLVIAVGGKPRIPERYWAFQNLMYTLKTIEDANTWIKSLSTADSVLIIGGDLTSLAVSKALVSLQKKVCFIFDEDALWPLRGNDDLIATVTDRLKKRGIEVLESPELHSMERLTDNSVKIGINDHSFQVDMVGAFFGLVPNIRFLARSGLRIDRGVLVDEYLNAGFPGIYAAGDCAQIYHPEIGDYWISIGHDNACCLGRIAATNLAGGSLKTYVKPESIFAVNGININSSWWTEI